MLGSEIKMTMIDDVADRTGLLTPTWAEVDKGFWVGNTDGMFLGTIERRQPKRYLARDAVRRHVGEYPTLALAREAIIGHLR
jgi:hypothetical protein